MVTSPDFNSLVKALPGIVAVFDRDMHYLAHNDAWVREYSLEDFIPLIGKLHYDVFPDMPDHWREVLKRCLGGETEVNDHDIFERADGSILHLKWSVSPWHTENGDVGGLVIVSRVISAEIEALEEERRNRERLQFALEGAEDGLWDWNAVTHEVYYSPRWCTMLGYDPEELPHNFETWRNLAHPDDIERSEADIADCVEQRVPVMRTEFRLKHKNGGYRWILSRGIVVAWDENNNPLRLVGTHTDITQMKELEARLMTASKDAARANMAKTDFLANMSHEIRTPLNGILGMAGLLVRTGLNEEQARYARNITSSGRALLEIINDILDISKLEAGRIELEDEHFNLSTTLDNVTSLLEPLARDKHIGFHCDNQAHGDIWLRGDSGRLRQILFNLSGNAIKFTEEGRVTLSAACRPGPDGTRILYCEVRDTGVGIPESEQGTLFERFTQVDTSSSRKYQGTGLGLAICKQLVELMGGSIDFESTPGKGSRFWFEIPFQIGEIVDSTANGIRVDREAMKSLRVLAAEDNPVNQLLIEKLMTAEGHSIDIVSNGEEAVAAVRSMPYDLILMDVQMPVMDGPTAARTIRSMDGDMAHVPIIAFTANAMKGQREEYLEAGMDDYVSKPVDPNALFAAISRVMVRDASTGGEKADSVNAPPPVSEPVSPTRTGEAALDTLLDDLK